MFSMVFSSYDFRIKFFFFVLECFQETLCIFIFLCVYLCNRGNLFRTSEGVLLLSDSFTPLLGLSQTKKTMGQCAKLQAPFLVSGRVSFPTTLLLHNEIFSSTPTASQPAGVHISSGSNGKWAVRHRHVLSSPAGKGSTEALWQGIGCVTGALAASKSRGSAVDSLWTITFFLAVL